MTKIDLITGFLGSGKTTFLKKYLEFLVHHGQRVCVLEFDYGAVNVDMMLLQEFNDKVDLEMVAGGCDYDCHLRRFKTKLIAMGMKKYDRVIIEPSGLFDTDEFFDTLYEEPLDNWYEIGSVISIVDAGLSTNLSKESRYVLANQIGSSGLVILSKTQNHSADEVGDTVSFLKDVMHEFGMNLETNKVCKKPYSDFDECDFTNFMNVGYISQPHIKMSVMESNSYSSVYFLNKSLTLESLNLLAKELFNKVDFGKVMRIKGFIKEGEQWYEFNMTANETNKNKLKNGQDVVIVIGENLNEPLIKSLFGE